MTTLSIRNLISRSPLRLGFALAALALATFALSQTARAQLPSPAPDGGYPGRNTAEGDGALFSLTAIGTDNTANGFEALYSDTFGGDNTANGASALFRNTTGSYNIASGINAGENLTTGDNNIDIFDGGVAGEANTIRIGTTGTQTNAYIAGIYQTTVANRPSGVRRLLRAPRHERLLGAFQG
jgi:hypothetical protein